MLEKKRILIVDDDAEIRDLLEFDISSSGYFVDTASDGMEGLNKALNNKYDLILLDVMMPKMNGFDVCKNIRQAKINVPILMLTAKGTISDKTSGFDSGADDYLVKPFSFQELEARIKALLRRSGNESVHMALRCGDLVLDPPSHRAIRNGQVIDLTVKEYRLLEYFIQNQGTALSRMNLLKNVWDKDFDTNTNVVDVYVNYLRTKIDKDFESKLIHTVVGVGYMMEA